MRTLFLFFMFCFVLLLTADAIADVPYAAVPVKQYSLPEGGTYSDWYFLHRQKLGREHSGSLYGKEYDAHKNLWMRVEGLSPESVRKNSNVVLTVPVSGELARTAKFYVMVSDTGAKPLISDIQIGEKRYRRSMEKGAEKLYELLVLEESKTAITPDAQPRAVIASPPKTIVHTASSVPSEEEAAVSISSESSAAAAVVIPQSSYTDEARILFVASAAFLLLSIFFLVFGVRAKRRFDSAHALLKEKEKECERSTASFEALKTVVVQRFMENAKIQESALLAKEILGRVARPFILDDELLPLVRDEGILTIYGENTIYLPFLENGRRVMVGNTAVNNVNKNIRDAIKQLLKSSAQATQGVPCAHCS